MRKKLFFFILGLCVASFVMAQDPAEYSSSNWNEMEYLDVQLPDYHVSHDTIYVHKGVLTETSAIVLRGAEASGSAVGYKLEVPADTKLRITMTSGDFDSYMLLLDEDFKQIGFNDDMYIGFSETNMNYSELSRSLTAGTYYLIATSYSSEEYGEYDVSIFYIDGKDVADYAYPTLHCGNDTNYTIQYVESEYFLSGRTIYSNDIDITESLNGSNVFSFKVDVPGEGYFAIEEKVANEVQYTLLFMDEDFNIINIGADVIIPTDEATTFYVLVLTHNAGTLNISPVYVSIPTIYIDPQEGSDENDGESPETAVASFAQAVHMTGDIAKYVFMSDITIDDYYHFTKVSIVPYEGRNVTVSFTPNSYINGEIIVFGSEEGTFDVKTNGNDGVLSGHNLTIKYTDIKNSKADVFFYAQNSLNIAGCSFEEDTVSSFLYLPSIDDESPITLDIAISDCYFNKCQVKTMPFAFIGSNLNMSNSILENCTMGEPAAMLFYDTRATLLNVTLQNNTFQPQNENYLPLQLPEGVENFRKERLAGIVISINTTVECQGTTSIDTNNYCMIDNSSSFVVNEDLDADAVARIIPINANVNDNAVPNYNEHEVILTGDKVSSNYNKFFVVQMNPDEKWIIDDSGELALDTEEAPLAISSVEAQAVKVYAQGRRIVVEGANNNIDIYDTMGRNVNRLNGMLPTGVYVVSVGMQQTKKVCIVK